MASLTYRSIYLVLTLCLLVIMYLVFFFPASHSPGSQDQSEADAGTMRQACLHKAWVDFQYRNTLRCNLKGLVADCANPDAALDDQSPAQSYQQYQQDKENCLKKFSYQGNIFFRNLI